MAGKLSFCHDHPKVKCALHWIVRCGGRCTVEELCRALFGRKRGPIYSAIKWMSKNGLIEVCDMRPRGTFNQFKLFLTITGAGRVWEFYLRREREHQRSTIPEVFARALVLEYALRPFVEMYDQVAEHGYVTKLPTKADMRFAADVLRSPGSPKVVYPWSPAPSEQKEARDVPGPWQGRCLCRDHEAREARPDWQGVLGREQPAAQDGVGSAGGQVAGGGEG